MGDLALGIPTLPVTRLSRYIQYKASIEEFIDIGNATKIVENVKIEDAEKVFEELITPWQEMSRKYIEEV